MAFNMLTFVPGFEMEPRYVVQCPARHWFVATTLIKVNTCPYCSAGNAALEAYDALKTFPVEGLPCVHCKYWLEHHADLQCLFSPTKFTPYSQDCFYGVLHDPEERPHAQ